MGESRTASDGRAGARQRGAQFLHELFHLRPWAQFEGRFNDCAQRFLSADEKFLQIVTGDILHHLAAALDQAPIRQPTLSGRWNSPESSRNQNAAGR